MIAQQLKRNDVDERSKAVDDLWNADNHVFTLRKLVQRVVILGNDENAASVSRSELFDDSLWRATATRAGRFKCSKFTINISNARAFDCHA